MPDRVARIAGVSMLVAATASAVLTAQTFRGEVTTVEVTVTVTDRAGRLMTDLGRDDFEIYEDGDRQPITQFSDKRTPVSVGVLLDTSESMRGQPMVDARTAVDRFTSELLDPGDEGFIAAFNHMPRVLTQWMSPPSGLTGRFASEQPTGGTAIYDAVSVAMPMFLRRHRGRAALIVISDGADSASDRTLLQTREALRRTDAFVYAIAIDSTLDRRVSMRVNPEALREITIPSGGYTEVVKSYEDVGSATERIATELNSQYTLGYAAPHPPDGAWRSIRVRIAGRDYVTRARRGYFATASSVDRPSRSDVR